MQVFFIAKISRIYSVLLYKVLILYLFVHLLVTADEKIFVWRKFYHSCIRNKVEILFLYKGRLHMKVSAYEFYTLTYHDQTLYAKPKCLSKG